MRIHLNIATAPAQTQRRFVAGTGLLGFLAIAALAYLSWHTCGAWQRERTHRERMTQFNSEIGRLLGQRQQLQEFFNRPEMLQTKERADFVNGLIQERSFPWTKIFMDFEKILPEGVHVIGISTRMVSGRVEVKFLVGAASDEAKLKFLRSLEDAKEFSHIQVLSELHPTSQTDPDRVRLELIAWYVTA